MCTCLTFQNEKKKKGKKNQREEKRNVSECINIQYRVTLPRLSRVCSWNTIIISIISRARSRHERISIRVASRAGTDCHRPFHVVLLILDQRSRRKKKLTNPNAGQTLLPYRNQYRYRVAYAGYFAIYFQLLFHLPFIRFVIRFITPSITRHSY